MPTTSARSTLTKRQSSVIPFHTHWKTVKRLKSSISTTITSTWSVMSNRIRLRTCKPCLHYRFEARLRSSIIHNASPQRLAFFFAVPARMQLFQCIDYGGTNQDTGLEPLTFQLITTPQILPHKPFPAGMISESFSHFQICISSPPSGI